MRKLLTLLILLVCVGLIAAGAVLPRMVGQMQDSRTIGIPSYEAISPLYLSVQDAEPSIAQLAMLANADSIIEVFEDNASMSWSEAEDAVYAALEFYFQCGLIHPFTPTSTDARCMFVSVPDFPELSGIIWSVTLVQDSEEGYYCLDLALDDKTGCLLFINYTQSDPMEGVSPEDTLLNLGWLYFTDLGIPEYGAFPMEELTDPYWGENALARRYRLGDVNYGEVVVDLHVYEYGFYMEFPSWQ